jgi:aurora kinase
MYEFLVGRAPFEDTPVMTQRRIARGDMTIPSSVSLEAKDLIRKVR